MANRSFPLKPIGAVFTPIPWAKWLLEQTRFLHHWTQGATICDPTAGNGSFIYALMDLALAAGIAVDDKMLSRVWAMEQQPEFLREFEHGFRRKYKRSFPRANLLAFDVVLANPKHRFDFLVGNPPWANFCDLPISCKAALKRFFLEHGLVREKRALLLGGARIDLAALIITMVLELNLHANGQAAFFLPLSLFLGEGAHAGFRAHKLLVSEFRTCEIWDFQRENIFTGIRTRVGAARFQRDRPNHFPVSYQGFSEGRWTRHYAAPIGEPTAPLCISKERTELTRLANAPLVRVRPEQKPRQGVNTCGANRVFIFDEFPDHLPSEFVFPLLTKECFRESGCAPRKFILLPYDARTGNPLTETEIKGHPALFSYLSFHQHALRSRKGALLGSWLKRGMWWACLGVGSYSFALHKVVWESYGGRSFGPQVFSTFEGKPWQPNQAMHTFIPCSTQREAGLLLKRLVASPIDRYLKSLRAEGTPNWAQPGRIKRFLRFMD